MAAVESPEAKAKLVSELLRSLARVKSDLFAQEGLRKQPQNSLECWEGKWNNKRVIEEQGSYWTDLFNASVQARRGDKKVANWKSVFQFLEVGSSITRLLYWLSQHSGLLGLFA